MYIGWAYDEYWEVHVCVSSDQEMAYMYMYTVHIIKSIERGENWQMQVLSIALG